jgi:hypothetical protein
VFGRHLTRRGPGLLAGVVVGGSPASCGLPTAFRRLTESQLFQLANLVQLRNAGILTAREMSEATQRIMRAQPGLHSAT